MVQLPFQWVRGSPNPKPFHGYMPLEFQESCASALLQAMLQHMLPFPSETALALNVKKLCDMWV